MFVLNFAEKAFLLSSFLHIFTLGNLSFEIFRQIFLKYLVLILQNNIQKYEGKVENSERVIKGKRTERKNFTVHFCNEINNKRLQYMA